MTVYLKNIKGNDEEANELFETANVRTIQVGSYVGNGMYNWDIVIRCNEDFERSIKFKRTIKSLIKAYK